MAEGSLGLAVRLAEARERASMSQEDVATLVGQPRTVISNWETGARRPNAQQLSKLAMIYRVPLDELVSDPEPRTRPEFERLLFRDAGERLDRQSRYEVQRFLGFLDAFGTFLEALDEPAGMTTSPFSVRDGFHSKEDVRRKAADARRFFRLGGGPVGDLIGLADVAGMSVYLAPLGADLKGTVSGAFLPHQRVGFSILINSQTTPGRQLFTLAHEIAHALFHGTRLYVDYFGRREADERFADAFAAEFLVPTQGLRSAVESLGLAKVKDAEVAVHLQRLFHVSYAMILVRLQSASLVTPTDLQTLRKARPVRIAERIGYPLQADEWWQDAERYGLARFPRRFLRLLRRALLEERISFGGAAAMTGLSQNDIEDLVRDLPSSEGDEEEFEYLRAAQ